MKWFVIYTKPNQEIRIASDMIASGINAYCPTYIHLKQYSDRKKKVKRPLIPSYVLVQLSEKDRPRVFSVSGVVRYLFWLGKPAEVRNEEIQLLKANLKGTFDDICISKLVKGSDYMINSGPFRGHKGTVIDVLKNKLRLELPSFGVKITLNRAIA